MDHQLGKRSSTSCKYAIAFTGSLHHSRYVIELRNEQNIDHEASFQGNPPPGIILVNLEFREIDLD